MAGRTNELVAWTDTAGRAADGLDPSDDEYDAVVASGEQVTAGLLAKVLRHDGFPARSWMGWQVPILTDDAHGSARIEEVPAEALAESLDRGEVAVIAGFQGVTRAGRIATLGRGGSDTSAVAIAAALKQEIWPCLDAGAYGPVIDSVFPLKRVAEAHRRMETSAHIGKIVLTVAG